MVNTIDHLLFLNSPQPNIDRGWHPQDAQRAAAEMGFHISNECIETVAELETLVAGRTNVLVWPACYTIGPHFDGPLLTSVLTDHGIPFVGPAPFSLRLSSKIAFKNAVATSTPYVSPRHHILQSASGEIDSHIGFPAIVKTEYSCNSEGVRLVNDAEELTYAFGLLANSFRQTVFVEKWERLREYTVAYLPPIASRPALAAGLELSLVDDRRFIDTDAKSSNHLLAFTRPDAQTSAQLEDTVINVAKMLGINGHFRLDAISNSDGELFLLEANFLPYLTRSGPARSYFPMAFELAGTLSYPEIISHILAHALERAGRGTSAQLHNG